MLSSFPIGPVTSSTSPLDANRPHNHPVTALRETDSQNENCCVQVASLDRSIDAETVFEPEHRAVVGAHDPAILWARERSRLHNPPPRPYSVEFASSITSSSDEKVFTETK